MGFVRNPEANSLGTKRRIWSLHTERVLAEEALVARDEAQQGYDFNNTVHFTTLEAA